MTNNETPKKPAGKKIFYVIALILGLLGIDHYTYHFASGGVDITLNDSTIAITPIKDSIKVDSTAKTPVAPDTIKK